MRVAVAIERQREPIDTISKFFPFPNLDHTAKDFKIQTRSDVKRVIQCLIRLGPQYEAGDSSHVCVREPGWWAVKRTAAARKAYKCGHIVKLRRLIVELNGLLREQGQRLTAGN